MKMINRILPGFDTGKASEWWALAVAFVLIIAFPTTVLMIWVPEWWGTRMLLTEFVTGSFCYLGWKITEDD